MKGIKMGTVIRTGGVSVLVFAVTLMAGGCSGILDVEDPQNLTGDDLEGGNVELTINGMRGAFSDMFDQYVLHTGLLTDEFVHSGTFPYRREFDDRFLTRNNEGLLSEVYQPLGLARFEADTGVVILENAGEPSGVDPERIQEGIALGKVLGGYSRLLVAEAFCEATIAGGPPLSSSEIMERALSRLQEAEGAANDVNSSELENAAVLGQARAQLWLGNYDQAASLASGIPSDFVFNSYYSTNSIGEKNGVYQLTWGVDEVIRWTVGAGTAEELLNEKFSYYDEWVDLGLIEPRPDLTSFNVPIPVHLQQKYATGDASIPVAEGAEADMIEAEAALRNGELGPAESIVNGWRAEWGLDPISFTGDLATDLESLARERSRELWITGRRLGTLRRLLDENIDLYPTGKPGSDTCFPIPQQEIDTNPNI